MGGFCRSCREEGREGVITDPQRVRRPFGTNESGRMEGLASEGCGWDYVTPPRYTLVSPSCAPLRSFHVLPKMRGSGYVASTQNCIRLWLQLK
jgi:hypothetical protein